MAILVSHGNHLQLIVYFLSITLNKGPHYTVFRNTFFEYLSEIDVFHLLYIEVGHAQHVPNVDMSLKQFLECIVKCATGFVVEVAQVSFLIIIGHIYQCRIENGLITQHVIACYITHPFFLCDITTCTDDDGRSSVPMVTQHRQCHGVFSGFAFFLTLCS